jgi:hypothetical protein
LIRYELDIVLLRRGAHACSNNAVALNDAFGIPISRSDQRVRAVYRIIEATPLWRGRIGRLRMTIFRSKLEPALL